MRKLKFTINPDSNKTEEKGFTHGDKILVYRGTPERMTNVRGLVLHLADSNGNTKTCPLTDTRRSIREDIRFYGCCWLEWTNAGNEYEIELELS